tara:strand:- start:18464 stop:18880 length:417 start_codon:yes stop_codon:yes gene_type:complete
MKIKNMRQPNEEGQWGKVKAFFDVENSGFEMKGFRLVEGINGLFVSMPSRKGTDENGNDKWFDTIWIESRDVREQLNTLALAEYNNTESANSDMMQSNQNSEPISNPAEEAATGDNIKSDNINSESSTPAFSDEDIPF